MRFKVDIHFNVKDLKVNRVVRSFVISDLLFWGGWGIVNPIFAIFVVNKVPGATIATVGAVIAMYWIVKAIIQIPVAIFLDRKGGDRADFHALILGLMLAGFAAIAFLAVRDIAGLFAVVFVQALAYGLYTPSWSAIFSRHLDKDHYAFDWSLDSTTVGIASGIAAALGGGIAALWGFTGVFILTSIFSFASVFFLLSVPNLVLPRATTPAQEVVTKAPGAMEK